MGIQWIQHQGQDVLWAPDGIDPAQLEEVVSAILWIDAEKAAKVVGTVMHKAFERKGWSLRAALVDNGPWNFLEMEGGGNAHSERGHVLHHFSDASVGFEKVEPCDGDTNNISNMLKGEA